jgi:hypothetical protein
MDIVLLRLERLAGIFIRFRERVCKLQISRFRMRFKRQGGLPKVLRFSMDIRLSVGARLVGVIGGSVPLVVGRIVRGVENRVWLVYW